MASIGLNTSVPPTRSFARRLSALDVGRKGYSGQGEGPPGLAAGLHGGAKRSRTADLLNAIQALYQLSYSPEVSGLAARPKRPPREGGGHYAGRFSRSR